MIYVDNRQEKIEVDEKLVDLLKNVIEFALKEEEVVLNVKFRCFLLIMMK